MEGDQKEETIARRNVDLVERMEKTKTSVGFWSMEYINARHNRSFCLVLKRRTAYVPVGKD